MSELHVTEKLIAWSSQTFLIVLWLKRRPSLDTTGLILCLWEGNLRVGLKSDLILNNDKSQTFLLRIDTSTTYFQANSDFSHGSETLSSLESVGFEDKPFIDCDNYSLTERATYLYVS